MLTQERLKELLYYDPDTGIFIWLKRATPQSNRINIGGVAGSIRKAGRSAGYCQIKVGGTGYQAHRLAYLYMMGIFPPNDIDHINMIKSDNRWCNLRLATNSQNQANRPMRSDNTSGVKGVKEDPNCPGHYIAVIGAYGKRIYLGYFNSLETASAAYEKAAKEIYGEFARIK